MSAATALRIETPRIFLPLLQPKRYKGCRGGRGSGKSHFFAEALIERCIMQPGTNAVGIREYQRTTKHSSKRLTEDKIRALGVTAAFNIKEAEIGTPGGGVIIFEGMQNHNADSIKSLEGFDVAWVDEAQTLSQRSIDLLYPTIRKAGSEIWFSWNPRRDPKSATGGDPVETFLDGNGDAVVVSANYYDNPWFTGTELQADMERDKARDPDKYAHVWLGGYERNSEARVFRNWRVEDFDTPDDAVFYLGADWGFAIDPTVLVRCFVDGRTLYIDREVYKVGCEIDRTPALFDALVPDEPGWARKWVIVADSSDPQNISYMKRHGYPRMQPSIKGAGSVEQGVEFLKAYDIVVHPRCKNTIDELTLYSFKTDRLTGEVLPVLEDKKNHVIDSIRYSLELLRRAPAVAAVRQSGFY